MDLKNFKRSLERAEGYLSIVRKIEIGECTNNEFEYIQANANTLQKEMRLVYKIQDLKFIKDMAGFGYEVKYIYGKPCMRKYKTK